MQILQRTNKTFLPHMWDNGRKKNASCLHGNGCQVNVGSNSFLLELFFYFFYFLIKGLFLIVYDMMSEPPGSKGGDEMCPICNKAKSRHLPEEMLACSRKMQESQDQGNNKSL